MAENKNILSGIKSSIFKEDKLLAILIDPDKFLIENTASFIAKINASIATHIFVGGSTVEVDATEALVKEIKNHTTLPVILFPGDVTQITNEADGLLFLSLISGRNPEYLIGKHIEAVSKLKKNNLEVIPTGYILIESGKIIAVQRVTNTQPISQNSINQITNTAKAAELLGMQLVYLEAGSGAKYAVSEEIIKAVKAILNIPLIVGGGIRSKKQLESAYIAGADLVVIGTAFEEDETFFNQIKK
ncbi:geranylgeranylglyceryl/heptaprenylglyceryl phosphate synthase [Neotamlana laminarinivorans]|uniref:Geranylgeranylglyceryl phosphate synthase n=1 Tax=Neotamlana laminarinivorans TaxID=2883124 RepID=A0A9X1I0X7_9FLAO|nr:geranylgeranylglyceryl/heptaprenylglyceryl phosphate synthase [Tamlana laminarinivorans]MCB4799778.1 geranylgeranylglyceryl/heptaprenylglyceryl phosphate synthase [Tamlana laminarinivorans]